MSHRYFLHNLNLLYQRFILVLGTWVKLIECIIIYLTDNHTLGVLIGKFKSTHQNIFLNSALQNISAIIHFYEN